MCAKANEKNGRTRRRKADPFGFALQQLRRNAKKRGFEFSLTKADFEPLPTHCPVLGVELDYSGSGKHNSASIDRSNSSKGYVPGNVVIMSRRANMLKNDTSTEELRKVLEYIENISKLGVKEDQRVITQCVPTTGTLSRLLRGNSACK